VVRVLTVDDHAPFLEVAREIVTATPGFESVGEASSAEEALDAIAAADPDLVLADVHMPGMDGIELTRRLEALGGRPVVILISARDLSELPSTARTCGAAAVVSKQDLGPDRLKELWRTHAAAAGGAVPP
jgi:two-component system invasion response regulator UvrY